MMRSYRQPPREVKKEESNHRVAIIAMAVFLLCLGLIGRLVYLQMYRHEAYASLAEGQHKTSYELLPERGKIFIQDNALTANASLYPIAINKEFAQLFAIPKLVENPEEVSEKLYQFFKQAGVEKEVDAALKVEREERLKGELATVAELPDEERLAKEAELTTAHEALMKDVLYLELEKAKRDDMIRIRKEALIGEYLQKLDQSEDIYELLERKLDEEKLRAFYIFMAGK